MGVQGCRFESCRPDSNNTSDRKVSQPVFVNALIMTAIVADKLRTNINLFVTTNFVTKQKKGTSIEFLNEMLTNCTAGKLRLSYPESITPEEIPF